MRTLKGHSLKRFFPGMPRCEGFSGPCPNRNATYRRQNTAYSNDKENFRTLCPECQAEADEYWGEQWQEYYNGRL